MVVSWSRITLMTFCSFTSEYFISYCCLDSWQVTREDAVKRLQELVISRRDDDMSHKSSLHQKNVELRHTKKLLMRTDETSFIHFVWFKKLGNTNEGGFLFTAEPRYIQRKQQSQQPQLWSFIFLFWYVYFKVYIYFTICSCTIL